MSDETTVYEMPGCDICRHDGQPYADAYADANIPRMGWANVCKRHFDMLGCTLGTGRGQRLVLKEVGDE